MTSQSKDLREKSTPPAHAAFYEGVKCQQEGRLEEAAIAFRTALRLQPDLGEAAYNLGVLMEKTNLLDEALNAYEIAARTRPKVADAHFGVGSVCLKQNRLPEARKAFVKALTLQPSYVEAMQNLGNVLRLQNDLGGAALCFEQALGLRPDSAELYANLANIYRARNELEKSEAACLKALALSPEMPEAHINLSIVKLVQGRLAEGWPHAEYRRRLPGKQMNLRIKGPQWTGSEDLAGKKLLLHGEQGLGDSMQYLRYLEPLKTQGARIAIAIQDSLSDLLRASFEGIEICSLETLPPRFDYHCPLATLPLAFGTTLESIPNRMPYLAAPRAVEDAWRSSFASQGKELRVGFSWAGNPGHSNDTNRSIPLSRFLTLFEGFDGVRFYPLKNAVPETDRALWRNASNVTDLSDRLANFAQTAGLVSQLDLVIAVDTSVVHLAGALAKPVWILLPFSPDWRWLLGRDDSPWYPTARLFRQPSPGNWDQVFRQVRDALGQLRAERRRDSKD